GGWLSALVSTAADRAIANRQRYTASPLLVLLGVGGLEHFDAHDARPLLEDPFDADAAADLELTDLLDHGLVRPAALRGCAADPVRDVFARFLLAVGLEFDVVVALGGQDADDGALALLVLVRFLVAR